MNDCKLPIRLEKTGIYTIFTKFSTNGAYLWNEKEYFMIGEDEPVYTMDGNGSKNYAASGIIHGQCKNGSSRSIRCKRSFV